MLLRRPPKADVPSIEAAREAVAVERGMGHTSAIDASPSVMREVHPGKNVLYGRSTQSVGRKLNASNFGHGVLEDWRSKFAHWLSSRDFKEQQ
jgi:hypothetical protein